MLRDKDADTNGAEHDDLSSLRWLEYSAPLGHLLIEKADDSVPSEKDTGVGRV